MSNPNENCLEGMRCPKPECGSCGPFKIRCDAVFTVHDDGTEDYEDVNWYSHSACICMECYYCGKVGDFKESV